MTRDDFLTCENPAAMLTLLLAGDLWKARREALGWGAGKPSDRKLRLFALAAVRLTDPDAGELRLAPQIERLADRGAPEPEYVAIDRLLSGAGQTWARHQALRSDTAGHRPALAALLREVVGDPLAPVRLPRGERTAACTGCDGYGMTGEYRQSKCDWCDGDGLEAAPCPWLTPDVLSIAQECYDRRDFRDLPVLADALEDAGCDTEALLSHLRSPGPHALGCWAIDLILDKE